MAIIKSNSKDMDYEYKRVINNFQKVVILHYYYTMWINVQYLFTVIDNYISVIWRSVCNFKIEGWLIIKYIWVLVHNNRN